MKRVWHVVLLTSAVWFMLDAFLLLFFMTGPATRPVVDPIDDDSYAKKAKAHPKFAGARATDEPTPLTAKEAAEADSFLQRLMKGLRISPGGPGEMGRPVKIDPGKHKEMTERFKVNQFNIMASDMISLNRSLPDVRNARCKTYKFDTEKLPSTSVIIVFHNEAWSTLLRSIHSVINRSPRRLLKEIILIDDKSERDYLGGPLERYIQGLPVHTFLRHMPKRSGLVMARLHGAKLASGPTMTFLDAHIEVTKGWLEPLMQRIAEERTRVVCPVIDVISDDTFEYVTASDSTWGGFNWKLQFRWFTGTIGNRADKSIPIKSPAMAGGLFSIDREYFYEIGTYDEGMKIWGGENLEMSFRIWQCGGSVEIIPCSHVGHVFRKQTPYSFPGGTSNIIHHNSLRTAEVWMEDYKQFFYKVMPGVENIDIGDVSARLKWRKDHKCKSFRWYLEHIYTESHIPAQYHSLGEVKNPASSICLDTMGKKPGADVGAVECHGLGGNQAWTFDIYGLIRADEMCVEAQSTKIKMKMCDYGKDSHKFQYFYDVNQLKNRETGSCLTVNPSDKTYRMLPCDNKNKYQVWMLEGYDPNNVRGGPAE